jgi:hypothetical protein
MIHVPIDRCMQNYFCHNSNVILIWRELFNINVIFHFFYNYMTYKSIKKLKLWLIKGIKFKIPTGHSKYKGRPCCNGVTSHKVLFHGDSLTISPNCDIRDVARGPAVCVLGQREPIPADLGPVVSDIPCFC